MTEQDNLRNLDSRLKELWGQLNNYVQSEDEKHFSILLAQAGLAIQTLNKIPASDEMANLRECVEELVEYLRNHGETGDWEAVTVALDGLREAFDLIQALRK